MCLWITILYDEDYILSDIYYPHHLLLYCHNALNIWQRHTESQRHTKSLLHIALKCVLPWIPWHIRQLDIQSLRDIQILYYTSH